MRTWNFVKGRRVTDLFRLCLAIIVLLTMAVGGITLNTQPVQAALTISQPSPCPVNLHVKPCVKGQLQFMWSGTDCNPGPSLYQYWNWTPLNQAPTGASSISLDMNTGLLVYRFCKDDIGKTFTFSVWVNEYCPNC